jgi:hypothetical protein
MKMKEKDQSFGQQAAALATLAAFGNMLQEQEA